MIGSALSERLVGFADGVERGVGAGERERRGERVFFLRHAWDAI